LMKILISIIIISNKRPQKIRQTIDGPAHIVSQIQYQAYYPHLSFNFLRYSG